MYQSFEGVKGEKGEEHTRNATFFHKSVDRRMKTR